MVAKRSAFIVGTVVRPRLLRKVSHDLAKGSRRIAATEIEFRARPSEELELDTDALTCV
jgi:hypothetical protein